MNSPATHPRPDDIARLLRDDGDAPPDLAGHLAACRECRENFERQAMGDTGWLLDAARTTAIPVPPELMASLRGFCSPLTGETLARLETLPDVTVDELMPEASGQRHRIGPYEVLGVVGRGGMGIVLQGHDVVLRRTVALKIPALSMRGDPVARGRFLREGRAAASITHPNVVPVLAVEEYAGVPVLVMPFVQGESLQQRLDRDGTVPPAEALRIGLETALALGAAHERGLVHRDVKPANILLESPAGHVRLTDFGLARAADDARLTQTGLGAGTPLFMSPEQARGEAVDARTDLFALGSVLFVMVTGKAPFAMPTLMGTLRRLADGSPDSPRLLAPNLPRHVEELIMDLLKNSPANRPADAGRVAERLRDCIRYIAEGTEPPRQRRRRRALTLAGLFFAATLATAGTVLKFPVAEGTLVVEIDDPEASVVVDRDGREMTVSGVGLKEVKLKLGPQTVKIQGRGQTREEVVSITRDGKPVLKATLIPADDSPNSTTKRGLTKETTAPPSGEQYQGLGLPWVEGSKATFPYSIDRVEGTLRLTGPQVWPYTAIERPLKASDFYGEGAALAAPGQPVPKFDWSSKPVMRAESPVQSLAVSPDGRRIVGTSSWSKSDPAISVWDAESGKLLHTINGLKGEIPCVVFTKDSKAFAAGLEDGSIRFWEDQRGKEIARINVHKEAVLALAMSTDGKRLASASAGADLNIQIHELSTGKVVRVVRATVGGKNRVRSLAFSPDGSRLISTGQDQTVRMWDADSGKLLWTRDLQQGEMGKVGFLPDGRGFFACADKKGIIGNPATGETIIEFASPNTSVTDLAFSPDGKLFAACDADGKAHLFSAMPLFKIGQLQVRQGSANKLAFAPDGRTLYIGTGPHFDEATKKFIMTELGIQRADITWPKDQKPVPPPAPLNPNDPFSQPRR